MAQPIKVLQVTSVDLTVKKLLLPLVDRLNADGYQVYCACSNGRAVPELQARGYRVVPISIERRINPLSNARSLWRLYRLIRKERFDVVHVHMHVSGVLGRIAAWAAGAPIVVYTVHGFYFHEHTPGLMKQPIVWLERLLCHAAHLVMMQSKEDMTTAERERICPRDKLVWIGNGVDVRRFAKDIPMDEAKRRLGFQAGDKVVGFVGRLVREKGILELIEAMGIVVKADPAAKLLLVGDTLNSDRDKDTKRRLRDLLEQNGLASRVVFAGFIEDVPTAMHAMDVFVLPSHREGMPRTIIEAMASSRPVVTTDIRGCREEVVKGVTGFVVPAMDPPALAEAVIYLLSHPAEARKMGAEGKLRAYELFDERLVLDRQMDAYAALVRARLGRAALKGERWGENRSS